jgi:hypothetical protein
VVSALGKLDAATLDLPAPAIVAKLEEVAVLTPTHEVLREEVAKLTAAVAEAQLTGAEAIGTAET